MPALGLLVLLGGCAADPRPATTEATDLTEEHGETLTHGLTSPVCTPGATQECKTFWNDVLGQLHCRLEEQVCRADGRGWQACGDRDAGPAPDAGSDVDADAGED